MTATGNPLGRQLLTPTPLMVAISILTALVAGLGVFAIEMSSPEQFEARAQLIIDQPRALVQSGDDGVFKKLGTLRIKYVELARTPLIITVAEEESELAAAQIARSARALLGPGSLGITSVGVSESAMLSVEAANALAAGIVEFAETEQEQAAIPPEDRFTIEVIEPASRARQVAPSAGDAGVLAVQAAAIALAGAYAFSVAVRALLRRR